MTAAASTRLTRRAEFLRAAAQGRKAARPGVVLQALWQPTTGLRLGFTATKRIGGAVVRNRAKRRLRAAARLVLGASPPAGFDLVLIARETTPARPFPLLLGDLRDALRQAGVPVAADGLAPPQGHGAMPAAGLANARSVGGSRATPVPTAGPDGLPPAWETAA